MNLEEKVDKLLTMMEALVGAANATPGVVQQAAALSPPDYPELTADQLNQATIDGKSIQLDGSTWSRTIGYWGRKGDPQQEIYGYISKRKDPALWDQMVRVIGSEARLQQLLEKNGKLARYKLHPKAVLYQGASSFNLFSMLLASPMPPQSPTV